MQVESLPQFHILPLEVFPTPHLNEVRDLSVHLGNWVKCTDDQWLHSMIQKGYRLKFARIPLGFSGIKQSRVQAENADILKEDAIQEVPAEE